MPEYSYRCCACNTVFRESRLISTRDDSTECECGGRLDRDIEAELASVGKRKKWIIGKERWSRSMGVPVKQLAEFRKRYPHHVYNDKGHLLVKNRKHKLKQAKERKFVELNDDTSKAWFR